jgi:hypothetical protein
MAGKSRFWERVKADLGDGIMNAINDIRQRLVEDAAWGRIATSETVSPPDPMAGIEPPEERRFTGPYATHFAMQREIIGALERKKP